MSLRPPSICRYFVNCAADSSPCNCTPVSPTCPAISATCSGVSLTNTPIFSTPAGSAAMISAAALISIRRVLGAKMNPNAFAPAATLACASRRLVVAQILTQVIGLRPPEPITLAKPRRDAVRASATRRLGTRRIPLAAGGKYHRHSRSHFLPPSLLREASSRPGAARYSGSHEMYASRGYSLRWFHSRRRARASTPRRHAPRTEHRVATRPPGGAGRLTPSESARRLSAARRRLGALELPAIGTHRG